ncbi:MAG: hypothetical protein ACOZQL_29900 [Myxococcota bacterium]
MSSNYRQDRRIDAIRPLSAVTKNEATEGTDLRVEQRWERALETVAETLREKEKPKRSFADLVKKK